MSHLAGWVGERSIRNPGRSGTHHIQPASEQAHAVAALAVRAADEALRKYMVSEADKVA